MTGNGFIPTGTGSKGARFGRDPVTNLAYKADGTVRQKRRTFTPGEAVQRMAEQASRAFATIGRGILKSLTALAAFRATVGTFRKWVRDARAYATPEACEERRAYHLRMLAAIDGKHAAAKAWLPKASAAVAAIDALYAKMGNAFADFRATHKADPTPAESEALVSAILTPDVRATVEGASNPANDPFAAFRRDAAEPDAPLSDEDEDALDSDDDDTD